MNEEREKRYGYLRRNTQSSSETTGARLAGIFAQTSIVPHNDSLDERSMIVVELDEELGGEVVGRVENGVNRGRERGFEVGTKERVGRRGQGGNLFLPIPIFIFGRDEDMLPYLWNEFWVNSTFLHFPSQLAAIEYRSDSHALSLSLSFFSTP